MSTTDLAAPTRARTLPRLAPGSRIEQMDPAVPDGAERDGLAFGQAVAAGCEPPKGLPAGAAATAAPAELDADLFVIAEQDMYPVDFDVPKSIAQRTRDYPRGVGSGGERR